jgi:hypothetical protein
MEKATKTDEVTDAVHYGEVCQFMTGFLQENTYKLLERAVAETMKAVLIAFPMLEGIDIEEADEMAISVAEEMRAEERQAEEALAEETEPVFDIMQLLAAEAEKLANVSPIDMMDTYGELVIDITLEELVHYNNAQRSKRRKR